MQTACVALLCGVLIVAMKPSSSLSDACLWLVFLTFSVQETEAKLAKLQAEADASGAALREARAAAEHFEEEATRLRADKKNAQDAAFAAKSEAAEARKAARASGGARASGEGQEAAEKELAALRKDMSAWLSEMQGLKEAETRAAAAAAEASAAREELEKERNTLLVSLEAAAAQIEELNAANSKLVGHQNAAQKVPSLLPS